MPTIAIIGASADRRKYGNTCVRAYASEGYTVYPIHPREAMIEGLAVYASIRDVPAGRIDRVSIYLPAAAGLKVLDEIATREVGEVWLNPGADDPSVVERGEELGLNIVTGCSIVDIGVSPHELRA